MDDTRADIAKWPPHGWLGLALVVVFWPLNWGLDGIRTHWGFFPLWLGYCLTVDALTFARTGDSLLTRNCRAYIGLFVASVPAWWLFELINERTQNWIYLDDGSIGPIEHALLASLAFSTVIPAVFGTAELASSFKWVRRLTPGPPIAPTAASLSGFFFVGLVMLVLTLAWPRYFFPFVWLSVFFILEPINHRLGNRTLLTHTSGGDWRPIVSLWIGVLICGFFWEFWNFWSFPKWIYDVPYAGFGRIFEMPVLGYGGYLPFALELFALYHLIAGIFGYGTGWNYLRLGDDRQSTPSVREDDPMIRTRDVIGVLSTLTFLTAVAVSSTACAQESRRTEPSSRPIAARADLTAAEKSVTALFEEATPSVVYITSLALRRDFFRFNVMEIPSGTGTGIVWDDRGSIVTNFHVIQDASRAEVTLTDGSNWEATLVGYAREKDLAVLHIDAPRDQLQPIRIGTSSDLKVGQSVLAIGNPFGFDQTLTTGIVSALGREIESTDGVPIRDVIQTDAAINPGNSGGPLLDSSGRLIGVNTAIVSPSGGYAGVGFAIPVDTVNWVVPQLIAYGRVQRPTMGVELASDHLARRSGIEGAVVTQVVEGSGADRAGMRPVFRDRRGRVVVGDVIVAINGEPIRSGGELGLALEGFKEGDTVTVTVNREGGQKDLRVKLGAAQ